MCFTLKKEQNNYDVLVLLLMQLSHLVFCISNSVVIVDGGTRIFFAQGTLATPLLKQS